MKWRCTQRYQLKNMWFIFIINYIDNNSSDFAIVLLTPIIIIISMSMLRHSFTNYFYTAPLPLNYNGGNIIQYCCGIKFIYLINAQYNLNNSKSYTHTIRFPFLRFGRRYVNRLACSRIKKIICVLNILFIIRINSTNNVIVNNDFWFFVCVLVFVK